MPLFDYICGCGTRFEDLVKSWQSPNPACPECGGDTTRAPSSVALLGSARPPLDDTNAPTSWRGTGNGDREYIANWRRTLEQRKEFEARHPEHTTKREAIAAHEGAFERKPLTYRELAARSGPAGDASKAAAAASKERSSSP